MSTVHHVEYVMIETPPLASEDTWVPEYDDLPEVFVAALEVIAAEIDCSLCGRCGDGVGYVLHEDDDEPWRSGLQWRAVWLAREDAGPVHPLCEDCSPNVPADAYRRSSPTPGDHYANANELLRPS